MTLIIIRVSISDLVGLLEGRIAAELGSVKRYLHVHKFFSVFNTVVKIPESIVDW